MSDPTLKALLEKNLRAVQSRILAATKRANRDPHSVRLLAVTKTRPLDAIRVLHDLGLREFAENRVQDARERIPELGRDASWHLIGSLQTNKVKYLPGLFDVIHTVDRTELVDALERAFAKSGAPEPLPIYLQFNIAGEEQKHGAGAAAADELMTRALAAKSLRVVGLMAMAPFGNDPEVARPTFRGLRELRDRLQEKFNHPLPELSMGMSGDYEVAIEEGATIVRVGSSLFEGLPTEAP